jgi:uncharacterized protein
MEDILLFAAVGLVAGVVQSLVGFGGGLIAIPILTMSLSPQVVIPSCVLTFTVMNVLLALETRAHVSWKHVFCLLAGGIVGAPIGAYALSELSVGHITLGINLLILLFAILLWCKVSIPVRDNPPTRIAVGLASGLLGGCTSMSGPPIVIFGLARKWDKNAFRGTLLAYFACLSAISFISYTSMGMVSGQTLVLALAALVAAVPAGWVGIMLKNRVSQTVFSTIVLTVISLLALSRLVYYFLG